MDITTEDAINAKIRFFAWALDERHKFNLPATVDYSAIVEDAWEQALSFNVNPNHTVLIARGAVLTSIDMP